MPEENAPNEHAIEDEELLYRRIYPDPDAVTENPGGGKRPVSGSLRSDGPLSVDRGSLCTPQQTRDRDTSSQFHVAAFSASVAREAGCRVIADPLPGNSAHALIYGKHTSGNGSLTKSQAKKIANRARVVLFAL